MFGRARCSTSAPAAGERRALPVDPLSLPRLLVSAATIPGAAAPAVSTLHAAALKLGVLPSSLPASNALIRSGGSDLSAAAAAARMNSPRRFVNLVLDGIARRQPSYGLHRVDVSTLFRPLAADEDEEGRRGGAMEVEDAQLPRAAMIFHPCPSYGLPSWPSSVDFMPLGSGSGSGRGGEKNDVVAVDYSGSGVLYGAASRAVTILPPMNTPKAFPVALTIGGNIYVMERYPASSQSPSSCFEVLVHDRHPNHPFATPHWHWRLLPPPPFAFTADDALDSIRNFFQDDDDFLTAYTAVGGSCIWMTVQSTVAAAAGTYSFDTSTATWTKLGDWLLPFRGRAEYAPEHKLWFALSSDGNELCASDLAAAAPPPRRNVWKVSPVSPSGSPVTPHLVPLGAGRFCIVRFMYKGWRSNFDFDEKFAVFTGVEVRRGCNKNSSTTLQMVNHRSRRYSLLDRVP
uniref:Uncharacterized protein n=1 Tax=Oryza rufipogon TaxID=4529 RepID=A0A0E0NQQ1_ORYRU